MPVVRVDQNGSGSTGIGFGKRLITSTAKKKLPLHYHSKKNSDLDEENWIKARPKNQIKMIKQRKTDWTIGTRNVQSLLQVGKMKELSLEIINYTIDLVARNR